MHEHEVMNGIDSARRLSGRVEMKILKMTVQFKSINTPLVPTSKSRMAGNFSHKSIWNDAAQIHQMMKTNHIRM